MNDETRDLSINFACQKNVQQFDYYNDEACQQIFEKFRTDNKIPTASTKNYLVMLCHRGTNDRITEIQLGLEFMIDETNKIEFKKGYRDVPTKPIILGDISWTKKIFVIVSKLEFYKNGTLVDNYETNAPVYGINDDLNKNYGFSDEDELENYYLLSNYYNNSINSRGILLNLMFQVINDFLDTKTLHINGKNPKFEGPGVPFVCHTLQIDIVAKIMMYIEDLITVLEANRLDRNYYDLLDKQLEEGVETDLGDRLGKFFKNLDKFTLDEWIAMVGYIPGGNMHQIKNSDVIRKIIENNIDETKQVLKYIKSFGDSHHRLFRRYKHAGFPARFDGQFPISPFGSKANFDSHAAIYVGRNPLTDMVFLPFSNEVLESYKILLPTLQLLIKDVIRNKMKSIIRKTEGIIPMVIYGDPIKYTGEEKSKYNEALVDYFQKNPNRLFDIGLVNTANDTYLREMTWYTDFDKNMATWKKNKEQIDKHLSENG